MAKTRQQKEDILNGLTEKFQGAKSAIFVNFDGLNVTDTQSFRAACRENNLDYVVAKKTLVSLALNKAELADVNVKQFDKGFGTIFGAADSVTPAQVVAKFAKDHEAMTILGGIMTENPEGERFLDLNAVTALSKLPTKDVLLGQLVGTLQGPISGFANVLAGNLRGLVTALNAIKDQKEA